MVLKKDYPYIFLSVILSALIATAVYNPSESIGTYALLGLIGIAVVMAIIVNPSLGAYVLLIAVFSNISAYLSDNDFPGIIKPLVVVVFGAILIRNYYIGQIPVDRPKTKQIEAALISYLLAVTASYLAASYKDLAMDDIIELAKDIVIAYCILFCLRNLKEWKAAILLVIAVTVVLSLLGIYQFTIGNQGEMFFGFSHLNEDNRLSGSINEPNMWGQVLVSVIPLAIFGMLRSSSSGRLVYGGALLILLIALLNTYSRGGYLSFFIIMFAVLFFFTRFNITLVTTLIVLAMTILPLLPPSYTERFKTILYLAPSSENGIYQSSSFRGRTSEMMAGLIMFVEHPILGIGVANYPPTYQEYAQIIGLETRAQEREAHSLYIEILAETGILGFVSFMAIVLFLFRGLSNIKTNLRHTPYFEEWLPYISAIQVSLVAYLFASIFLHGSFSRFFWLFVALAMALIQLLYELINNQENHALESQSST